MEFKSVVKIESGDHANLSHIKMAFDLLGPEKMSTEAQNAYKSIVANNFTLDEVRASYDAIMDRVAQLRDEYPLDGSKGDLRNDALDRTLADIVHCHCILAMSCLQQFVSDLSSDLAEVYPDSGDLVEESEEYGKVVRLH